MDPNWLSLSWKALIVRGSIAVIFGIVAIIWPIETATALALLWGFWALIDGIGSLYQAFQGDTGRPRFLLGLMGVLALIAAFFAIFSPALAAVTLTWILGIWLIVRGVFELFGAFSAEVMTPRWMLLLGAAIDFLLGILFVANPGKGAVGIAFVLGLSAIAWGAVFIAAGFAVRAHSGGGGVGPDAVASI